MKTLKISEQAHTELTKVKGEIMARIGKPNLTYEDVIIELIKHWRKN